MTTAILCTCKQGWKPCEITAAARCYVCDEPLCEACSRLELYKGTWIRVCGCGTRVCYEAWRLGYHREREAARERVTTEPSGLLGEVAR